MIGAVVCISDQIGAIDDSVYYKYGDRSILEITTDNTLKAETLQRVIVCSPTSQRTKIHGGGINKPLIRLDRSFLGRKPSFHFYNESEGLLGGIFGAAMTHGLDHVVVIHANCPLLPTWLINNMVLEYFSKANHNKVYANFSNSSLDFNPGFRMQILPFWILAREQIYSTDKNDISFNFKESYDKVSLTNSNESDSYITETQEDLRFTRDSNVELFDYFLSEIDMGADLGELIRDLNDKSKDN